MSSISNALINLLQNKSSLSYNAVKLNQCVSLLLNYNQQRYRKAVAFREYRQPHFKQKLLLAVCEPVYLKPSLPTSEKCGNNRQRPPKPHHPYDVLLAKDMFDELEQSKLICIFHQNQMFKHDRRLMSNEFEHIGMKLRYYNRDIVKICVENTDKYEPLLNFIGGYPYTLLFAPDFSKIDRIFKIVKKYPQTLLIGALVEHRRLITIDQLAELSEMGDDLDQQRALLCNTLTMVQQSMLSILNHHLIETGQLLKTHQKQLSDPNPNKTTKSENN